MRRKSPPKKIGSNFSRFGAPSSLPHPHPAPHRSHTHTLTRTPDQKRTPSSPPPSCRIADIARSAFPRRRACPPLAPLGPKRCPKTQTQIFAPFSPRRLWRRDRYQQRTERRSGIFETPIGKWPKTLSISPATMRDAKPPAGALLPLRFLATRLRSQLLCGWRVHTTTVPPRRHRSLRPRPDFSGPWRNPLVSPIQ